MVRGACPPDHRHQRQTGEFSSSAFGEITSSTHTQDLLRAGAEPTHQAAATAEARESRGTGCAGGREPGLVHGRHGRSPRRRAAVPAAERAGRLQPRGPGHRGRFLAARRTGGPVPEPDHRMARQALGDQGRQRPRIRQFHVGDMGREAGHCPDLHPARQATAERLRRALQPDGPARMAGPLHL